MKLVIMIFIVIVTAKFIVTVIVTVNKKATQVPHKKIDYCSKRAKRLHPKMKNGSKNQKPNQLAKEKNNHQKSKLSKIPAPETQHKEKVHAKR